MQTIYDLSEQLGCAESEDTLKQFCESFCSAVGFEHYLFAVCSVTSLCAPQIRYLSNYPDDWSKQYFSEGYQKHDPVVKYCFENMTPVRWSDLISMEQYVDAEGADIMRCANDFGLVNGLSIPFKSPTGEVAIFSLSSRSNESIDQRLLEALPFAYLFGTRLFASYRYLNQADSGANTYKITAREKECLFWACEGKTTWEISKIMEVAERTIVFHLTSATKKLGAVNRQHAVAKAIIHGLIKATP